jgi:hypothetical protein
MTQVDPLVGAVDVPGTDRDASGAHVRRGARTAWRRCRTSQRERVEQVLGAGPVTGQAVVQAGDRPSSRVGARSADQRRSWDVLEAGRVTISGTHHGHRLALIAGAACMRALDEAAFERLNGHAVRIMSELNEWSAARNSPFLVYGKGFSHLAYAYLKAPGLEVRTHRDYCRHVDGEKTQSVHSSWRPGGSSPSTAASSRCRCR